VNSGKKDGWLNVKLTVDEQRLEAAEALLFELGAAAVSLLDAADHPLHEPGPGELPMWPQVILQALFPDRSSTAEISEALLERGFIDSATAIEWSTLADRDWTRAWMDRYKPMRFGSGLWICPSHLEPEPHWPTVIRLDPGLAFGSGTHPTTALCLEWIDQECPDTQAPNNRTVVDFGCGSGVLAIAAALKGAEKIIAVDHDPQALSATMDNARRNSVADRITTAEPESLNQHLSLRQSVGLVVANILARPLMELAHQLSDLVAVDGCLVLSGILPEQAKEVAQAYVELDAAPDYKERDGWVRLVFRRPAG
jgi:ribosomal protein L11 methyltransferase